MKIGWGVEPRFQIGLHNKNNAILEQISKFFGVGKIYKQGPELLQWKVQSFSELERVIKHFNKFSLRTKKLADLKLFIMVYEIMRRKEHLTENGLCKIVAIRAAMNLGLSDVLKKAFPDVIPVVRPENPPLRIGKGEIIYPHWLAGFTTGEACFYINIRNSKTHSIRFRVQLFFIIVQHERDENLMRSLINFFNCGEVYKKGETFHFQVSKFDDITQKIIPFFKKYPIHGMKALDFHDWCKAAELIMDKKHLTAEGLEKIKKIKAGINRVRKLD